MRPRPRRQRSEPRPPRSADPDGLRRVDHPLGQQKQGGPGDQGRQQSVRLAVDSARGIVGLHRRHRRRLRLQRRHPSLRDGRAEGLQAVNRLRLLGIVALAALALAGCTRSDASVAPTPGKAVKALALANLPPDLLGLKLAQEDVSDDLAKVPKAFIDALSLYSLRHNDLVMATLQVSRFNDGADVNA